jgi:crotonobetaine/carnitine-CoA ligase
LIYLRRRGENTLSFEVESVLVNHGALADAAVHAVPNQLSEHGLKVIAVLPGQSAVVGGRTLQVVRDSVAVLRASTPNTWDVEAAGIEYERR